jgi:Protein of unknown function (DUF3999)
MKRLASATAVVAATCGLVVAVAQEPSLRFSRERAISTAGTGPQRLGVDMTLLEGAKPFRVTSFGDTAVARDGLADLRLFDSQGRAVPHLLIYPPSREPSWVAGTLLPIAATKKSSGFELDLGRPESTDAVRLDGIPAPFLKRLALEGSGDRAHWTMVISEGTLFDLPDEQLRETTLVFRRGSYRYLRVTFDDTNSGRVAPPRAVFARRTAGPAPPPPPAASLAFERRPSEPGRSRYRIRLPAPHLPIVALDLDVSGGHVFRPVVVNESRLAGEEAVPSELGRATLRRVLRDGAAAQALRVPLTPPAEAELELVVEDGNNPPLELKGVSASFADLPWIYFEAPEPAIVARYGDPAAAPPRFDLEAMRESIDVAALRQATWQRPRVLVESDAAASAAAFPAGGAAIDTAKFRFTRDIADPSGGLVALPLDAAVLSRSRGPSVRFADVRIVDRTNRQIPYLVERRDEPLSIDVPIAAAGDEHAVAMGTAAGVNRSIYVIRLPYPNLPARTLTLETSARVFERRVQMGVLRPPDRRRRDTWFDVIAASTWRHADPQTAAAALTMQMRAVDATELRLAIDEGDNAALPIIAARLLLPSYRLRFFHGDKTELRLVYGRDDLPPPRYDLSLLAPQVMGAAAREIAAAPERGGTGSSPPAFISPRVFWAFLGTVVVALLVLIVRLVRTTTDDRGAGL